MRLDRVVPVNGAGEDEVLALAAAAESGSEHPIARAVDRRCRRARRPRPGGDLARGRAGRRGHRHRRRRGGARDPTGRAAAGARAPWRTSWGRRGLTVFAVWRDGIPYGLIAVSDRVKPEARDAVGRLEGMGLDVAMVSGDRRPTAEAIAAEAGIGVGARRGPPRREGRRGPPPPERRDARWRSWVTASTTRPRSRRRTSGSRSARAPTWRSRRPTSPCSGGALTAVADALDLARRTYRVIPQNLFWAFAYNVVMIPLAVLGVLDPMWAAGAMAMSSVSVVLNALRLRRFQTGPRRDPVPAVVTRRAVADTD